MNGKPIPFQAPMGTPIVGQPVTLIAIEGIRLNAVARCNCRPENENIAITNGEGDCVVCGKHFVLIEPPTNPQLRIVVPSKPEIPA